MRKPEFVTGSRILGLVPRLVFSGPFCVTMMGSFCWQ